MSFASEIRHVYEVSGTDSTVIFIAKNSLTLSSQVLGWFCGAKDIDQQEFFKDIFLS